MKLRRFVFYFFVVIVLVSIVGLAGGIFVYARQTGFSVSKMDDLLQWEADYLLNDPHYAQQFIRTAPPEPLYNCHGFTFARAQRAIDEDEVGQLLKSNRYRKVTFPVSGDVVVYYDNNGNICHSGIVKATGRQGFVLVESKWGTAGRFLHVVTLPRTQAGYAYYRRQFNAPYRQTVPRP